MEGDHMKELGIDGRIILKWIFREMGWRGMDWIDVAGCCESGNFLSS
jgi:hypothetical protein